MHRFQVNSYIQCVSHISESRNISYRGRGTKSDMGVSTRRVSRKESRGADSFGRGTSRHHITPLTYLGSLCQDDALLIKNHAGRERDGRTRGFGDTVISTYILDPFARYLVGKKVSGEIDRTIYQKIYLIFIPLFSCSLTHSHSHTLTHTQSWSHHPSTS